MIETTGDLFSQKCDTICITTNGYVNRDGHNIMGAGVAGAAKRRWPEIPSILGRKIQEEGHRVHLLTDPYYGFMAGSERVPYHLVAFPTKPERVTEPEDLLPRYYRQYADYPGELNLPGWMAKSQEQLIAASCLQLVSLTQSMGWGTVVLPRPGCANGGLSWEKVVRPIVRNLLDDRFTVITWQ